MTTAYIHNRCFNNCLKQTESSAITGRKPNLSNMRVFWSECYAYRLQNKQKLDPRCTKGIFLGYDKGSQAYLVYTPDASKVMKYSKVKFPKTRKRAEQQTQTERLLPDDDDDALMPPPCTVSDVDRCEKFPDGLAEQTQPESETGPTCQPPNKGCLLYTSPSPRDA